MTSADGFLAVRQLWRYPVKSLGGQRVEASLVNERGLVGDRLWAVRDEDGKLGSGKDSRRFRRMEGLLGVTARYEAEPGTGQIEPPVVIGPDGAEYPVASGAADDLLRGDRQQGSRSGRGGRRQSLRRSRYQPDWHGDARLAPRRAALRRDRPAPVPGQPGDRHRRAVHRGSLAGAGSRRRGRCGRGAAALRPGAAAVRDGRDGPAGADRIRCGAQAAGPPGRPPGLPGTRRLHHQARRGAGLADPLHAAAAPVTLPA